MKMVMKYRDYRLVTQWSPEDHAYIATCPDFPSLSAFGATPAAAFEEMQTVLNAVEEILRKRRGEP